MTNVTLHDTLCALTLTLVLTGPRIVLNTRPRITTPLIPYPMALIVQKYGGTSVGSVERIGAVADRVARFKSEGHDVVVVVSAMFAV